MTFEETTDAIAAESFSSWSGEHSVGGTTVTLVEPRQQDGSSLVSQRRDALLGPPNAKLAFHATLARDATGHGLYLKESHERKQLRPLRQRSEDV